MLLLLKNHLNYLKDNFFKCFFKKYNVPLFFGQYCFSQNIIKENLRSEEGKIIKYIRNLQLRV